MIKTLIAGLVLATAIPATATPETRHVRYDDLELSTTAGMEQLEHRIDNAARDICIGNSSQRILELTEAAQIRACVNEVKARAAQQVAALATRPTRGD